MATKQKEISMDKNQEKTTWTTEELRTNFEVLSFLAPFVVVKRKVDGVKGTMQFNHSPRVYFDSEEAIG